MIRGIIFDFGFTLFYFNEASLEKYLNCYKRGLKKSIEVLKGLGILKQTSEANKFMNKFNSLRTRYFRESMKTNKEYPTSLIFKQVFEFMNIKEFDQEFLNHLTSIYHSCEAEEWIPFQKTENTLKELSKIPDLKLALLSNHPHHNTIKNLIQKHKLLQYFDMVITSALFGKRKPHIEIFNYTVEKMGFKEQDKKHIIMCGDEYADIMGAHRAGLQILLFERQYKFPYEKEIPLANIKKIQDISEILNIISI
jgi:HAD superfamily hydrolase (TIGR01549 family)